MKITLKKIQKFCVENVSLRLNTQIAFGFGITKLFKEAPYIIHVDILNIQLILTICNERK